MGKSTPVLSLSEKEKLKVHGKVKIVHLINEHLLKIPARLEALYKDIQLTALITKDGKIVYEGKAYATPSGAAIVAKNSVTNPPDGKAFLPTDGWTFWKYLNPDTGRLRSLNRVRAMYLMSKGLQDLNGVRTRSEMVLPRQQKSISDNF